MSPVDKTTRKPSWWKDALHGFIAWIIAFVLFMIPAFVVAIRMGFDLGPKLNNNAEVSRRISHGISEMYGASMYLRIGYIAVLGMLVFWRSRVITGRSADRSILHGAAIGSVAAILVALQMISYGAGMYILISVVVSIAAGVFGGMKRVDSTVHA